MRHHQLDFDDLSTMHCGPASIAFECHHICCRRRIYPCNHVEPVELRCASIIIRRVE
jgi:hypothetical protein